MIIQVGKHNARGRGTAPAQLAVVAVLLGGIVLAHYWVTPQILHLTCRFTDCAPRAVALAGWATIAGAPAAIGLVVLAHHRTEGWRWWLTMTAAALVGAPGLALIPGHSSNEMKWSAFDGAPGLDAFRTGTRTAILAAASGAIAYGVCALAALLSEPDRPARSRRLKIGARVLIALAAAAGLATVLLQPLP